ncbi:hypothetical protein J4226_00060 [Candidatus Pacearchaeota archaeon]|nr:hypothetical protein [Candidatus Pacearchaeota archaeon]
MQNPRQTKISVAFVNILAILSILGFTGIISYTLFNKNIDAYTETLWLLVLGLGFIIESSPIQLFHSIRNNLGEKNFTSTTTLIIGVLAVIAAALSLPQINIQTQAFLAIKGIMSIIAVIFIIVQTWVIK